MRTIRELFRKLRYKLSFFIKKKQANVYYVSSFDSNNELTNLMNFYGSDKGGKNNDHNYASYYSQIFSHKKNEIKNFKV